METMLIKTIRQVLESQKLAVLATHFNGQPYTTLVAFVASNDLRYLMFSTLRSTRKFSYIAADRRVSMLIHNSVNSPEDFSQASAVTVMGEAHEVDPEEDEHLQAIFLSRHPYLEEFVLCPDNTLFQVRVHRYGLVRAFEKVGEWDAASWAPA